MSILSNRPDKGNRKKTKPEPTTERQRPAKAPPLPLPKKGQKTSDRRGGRKPAKPPQQPHYNAIERTLARAAQSLQVGIPIQPSAEMTAREAALESRRSALVAREAAVALREAALVPSGPAPLSQFAPKTEEEIEAYLLWSHREGFQYFGGSEYSNGPLGITRKVYSRHPDAQEESAANPGLPSRVMCAWQRMKKEGRFDSLVPPQDRVH